MALADHLLPADHLIYRATGTYGAVIALHTWHREGHIEVYRGEGESVASRDGLGVSRYPLRDADLMYVLRPKVPVDLAKADAWFATVKGSPYGWLDLLNFVGLPVDAPGMVCSTFALRWDRAGGFDPLNGEPARLVAPFEFKLSDQFTRIDVLKADVPTVSKT